MEDPRIGLVLGDRYRIQERLAAGGTGVVYRGVQLGLARTVAIKFLHQSSAGSMTGRGRFRREAEAMSRLTHPNLAAIIDFGSYEDTLYLVMELYEGMSLRQILEAGPLEPARAVNITRQILAGLASAHDAGVVHRDLKPGNVLLAVSLGDDHVKILDFGVAKLIGGPASTEGLSVVAGKPIGTPQYMSPEQARGEQADPRTDLYAVGILLYEMVTGTRPFDGGVGFAILRQQVEDDPTPPRELRESMSPELEAAILKAMNKAPVDRFQSAADMAAALALVPELEPPRTEKAAVRARRFRAMTAVLMLLLLVSAGGTWFAADQGWLELPAWSPWHPANHPVTARVKRPVIPEPAEPLPPPPPPWSPPDAEIVLGTSPPHPAVENKRLRGRLAGEPFRPAYVQIAEVGERAVVHFTASAPDAEIDPCAVDGEMGGVALEVGRDRLRAGERMRRDDDGEVSLSGGAPVAVRYRFELASLDVETGAASGTVQLRGEGVRLAGRFDAVYCPDPRAYPTEPPRVNGARWDPDRAPAPEELPARAAAGAFGPAELHPAHVSLVAARDPDRLILSFFEHTPADPCAELGARDLGVAVVLPASPLDETYALSALLERAATSEPPWVGLQPDASRSPGPPSVGADILSLQIDAVSAVDVRGRIYVAAADRRRSLFAGAFRAVDCR